MEEVEIRERKRGHGLPIFLLCLAFLLIGAGLMYYYLIIYINRGSTNNVNTGTEILNTNGSLVTTLIDRMDYDEGCGINSALYKKSKFTVGSLDKNYVRTLVAKEANGKNLSGSIGFTIEDFETATKTLFGDQIVLSDESITSICPSIVFDSVNQKYVGDTSCTVACNNKITNVRYITKAEKDSKNVYIYVAVASVNEESRKVSNINDLDSVIEGIDGNTFNIAKDYDKVNNYKYTFEYDSGNNNYIFKGIEIYKEENNINNQ